MKIIYNDVIPFGEFKCVNLFGVLFVRNGYMMNDADLNHERIHTAQILEMFIAGFVLMLPFVLLGLISPWWLIASLGTFYYWYFVEWLIELSHYKDKAYHTNTFEREAHENDENLDYLRTRKRFAWWWYR